ncbi:MAG: MFS transporter [Lachnospiraceae bacterium]|nr:MFS transporter [Lachnospiraceae bacterium]
MKQERTYKLGLFNSKFFDSKVTSANIQTSEKVWGYFVGPMFMYMAYYAIAGTYLTQFYTDVLGIGGVFLTMMPVFSKIFDAITNVVMGRIIDKTRTRQGKARPWLAISGVLIMIAGIGLYTVPKAGYTVQIVWIIISYNLFFALAFTIYNMSHTLMVPLATRNTKQRDSLAMLTSMGTSMIPGFLVVILLPFIIKNIGVGPEAQSRWILVMGLLSVFALPAVLIEYYFTKERVTEESINDAGENNMEVVPMADQIKACLTNKYWLMVMAVWALFQFSQFLSTNSMIYFANWVLGSSVAEGATNQVLINAIGQFPLGIGIVVLWPLVKKFGKRWVFQIGFVIGAIGCLIVMLNPTSLIGVVAGLFIKSWGALPTYAIAAVLAEAMDQVEYTSGFRVDGFTASINTIIATVAAGIGQSIILGGINTLGYIAPASSADVITQPHAVQTFFTWAFVGICMIAYLVMALIMTFYDAEDHAKEVADTIIDRHRKAAEARGEVYISPEEKAEQEQIELERKAEEDRIRELKAKCAKKGLNFEEEEAKYQEKLAKKKAKANRSKK